MEREGRAWRGPSLPFAAGSLLRDAHRSELSCVSLPTPLSGNQLLGLSGELAGREGLMGTALLPASEAMTGHPGCGGTCHHRARAHLHRGGDAGESDRAQGQVQIVLKHSNELGLGGAKEFSMSAVILCTLTALIQ